MRVFLILLLLLSLALPVLAQEATTRVQLHTFRSELTFPGVTIPPEGGYADVKAPYSNATVHRLFVTPGQSVQKGEVVALLLHPSSKADYDKARQTLLAARDSLQSAKDRYQTTLKSYENRYQASREAEILAREAVRNAEERLRKVYDRQLQQLVRQNRRDLTVIQARRLEAQRELALADSRLWQRVQPYERQLRLARAQFAQAEQARKAAQVYAPISGQVLEVLVGEGDTIVDSQALPMMRIVDLSELQVKAELPAGLQNPIAVGTPVELHFENGQQTEGRVTQAYPSLLIEFPNRQGELKPWMRADIQVSVERQAVAVPWNALTMLADGTMSVSIRSPQGGAIQRLPVRLGARDGDLVEIVSELPPGLELLVVDEV